jgi:hypothetical protein
VTDVELRSSDGVRARTARLAAVAASLRRWTVKLALGAAVAAAVIVYAVVRDGYPGGGEAVLATIAIVAAALPPAMLAAFWLALGELIELPERVRRLPLEGREHGRRLRDVVDQARVDRGRRFSVPRTVWRLMRLGVSARETLTPYAPLLPFLSVPFLFGVAVAMIAAVVELIVAAVLVVVLAVG